MPDDISAVVPAVNADAGQKPDGVSSQKTPVPTDKSVVPPAADDADKKKSEEEASKATPEDKEGKVPFHQHPAWQRQMKNQRILRQELKDTKTSNKEMMSMVKQLLAHTKGEEYVPEAPVEEKTDYDSVLEDDIEIFSEKQTLSMQDQKDIAEVAKEYGMTLEDGTKIPMAAETAYKILLKIRGDKPKEQVTDPVKPKVEEKPVAKTPPAIDVKKMSMDQIMRIAKAGIKKAA